MSRDERSPGVARAAAPEAAAVGAPRDGRLFDALFIGRLATILGVYLALILGLLVALGSFTSASDMLQAMQSKEIGYAFWLSLETCTLATIFSLWIAVPAGYLLSRFHVARPRWGRTWRDLWSWLMYLSQNLLDALLDIPIVLPPLVIGLALLILFQTPLGKAVERVHPVTFDFPAIILAQFTVACAFAVRTMRVTFDQISPRSEQVALTLGCSRRQAFWLVVFPEARRGLVTAATLSWARSLGEFGPILVFAGATRMRTEVLPTTVFLELSVGNIEAAAAVSLIMVAAALAVLLLTRIFGLRGTGLI